MKGAQKTTWEIVAGELAIRHQEHHVAIPETLSHPAMPATIPVIDLKTLPKVWHCNNFADILAIQLGGVCLNFIVEILCYYVYYIL